MSPSIRLLSHGVRGAALVLAILALGCNDATPSGAAASSTASASAGAELLGKLTADNPDIHDAAKAIVASGDDGTRLAAGARLVAVAREVGSAAWRAAKMEELQKKNAGVDRAPQWFEQQLAIEEKNASVEVYKAMIAIGGAYVAAFGFELGEDEKAPLEKRQAALAILEQVIAKDDEAAVRRRAALAAQLETLQAAAPASPSSAPDAGAADAGAARLAAVSIGGLKASGGAVANSAAVVAGMAAGFRRCVNRAWKDEPDSVKDGGSLVMTASIGPSGEVVSAKASGAAGLPASAVSCMQARVSSAQFAPPTGGSAKVEFPITVKLEP